MTESSSTASFQAIVASLPPLEGRELHSLTAQAAKQAKLVVNEDVPTAVAERTCTAAPSKPPADSPFVDAIKTGIQQYQDKQYSGGNKTARHCLDTNDEGHLVLRTYAEKIDTHKSRTGYWAGCWIIEDEKSVRGTISLHVYNYEDGHMHLRAQREVPSKSVASADDVIKAIKRADNTLLSDVTDQEALTSSLKRIRRILPITKTRMKWSDAAQNAIKLLNERSSHK